MQSQILLEYSHTAEIASGGALPPLVATLSSPDVMCQRYAAMGMESCHPSWSGQDFTEGALEPLCDLASFSMVIWNAEVRMLCPGECGMREAKSSCGGAVHLMGADDVELRNSATFGVANCVCG